MRLLIVLLSLALVAALAQAPVPPPNAFVPIIVTQADLQELDKAFLDNAPRTYENVVTQWITGLEARAQAAAKAKVAPPAKSAPKTPSADHPAPKHEGKDK